MAKEKLKSITLTETEVGGFDLSEMIKVGVFVPNWFEKEHFEEFIGKKLTNEKFEELCSQLEEKGICDEVSRLIEEWLNRI